MSRSGICRRRAQASGIPFSKISSSVGVTRDQVQPQFFGFFDQWVARQWAADSADYGVGFGVFGVGFFQVVGRETSVREHGDGFAQLVIGTAYKNFSAGCDGGLVDLGAAADLTFGSEHAGFDVGAHDSVDAVQQITQCFDLGQGVAVPHDFTGDAAEADVDVFGAAAVDPGDAGVQAMESFVQLKNRQMVKVEVVAGGNAAVLLPSAMG